MAGRTAPALMALAALAGAPLPQDPEPLSLDCASFPADLSAADLAARFGAANTFASSIHLGEGVFDEGTIVLPGTDVELEVLWSDRAAQVRRASSRRSRLRRRIIRRDSSRPRWRRSGLPRR